jgi:hypothetical protein
MKMAQDRLEECLQAVVTGAHSGTIEKSGELMNDKMAKDGSLIPVERIERLILLIRGHKVMLDSDLAELVIFPSFRKILCFN